MRLVALVAAALAVPTLAAANPVGAPLKIFRAPKPKATTEALTSISHIIYVNNCMPDGCDLKSDTDDARFQQSEIAAGNVHMSPWKHGQASWDAMVRCIRDTYSPFDLQIVTEDPGPNVPHSEIIMAGTSAELNPDITGAGGISPTLGCNAQEDNHITFMFGGQFDPGTVGTSGFAFNYLCGGAAQETSHAFGLDHELDAKDPLTYLDLGSHKTFQDSNPRCGEELASPRDCWCDGQTQNTYQFLLSHFGPPNPKEAHVTITSPRAGSWQKPGFPVKFTTDDELSLLQAAMGVDGGTKTTVDVEPFVFNVPLTITPGEHTIEVTVKDFINRDVTGSTTVKVLQTCEDSCDEPGFTCLGGVCYPPASVDGGIGGTCAEDNDCATAKCASDGTNHYCTTACTVGEPGTCPSGFDCLETSSSAVCWPAADDGGCSTSGAPTGSAIALAALGLGLVLRRRR